MLLALLSLFWGLGWPAMKIVLSEVRPWTFRTICLMAAGGGLLALARAGGHRPVIPAEDLKPLLVTSIINITGWHLLSAHGIAAMQALRAEGIHKAALVVMARNLKGNAFWEKVGFTTRPDLVYRNKLLDEMVRYDS